MMASALAAIRQPASPLFSARSAFALVASGSMIFQVGHFYEHAAQFTVWLLGSASGICGRDTPWMSPWVTSAVETFGLWAWPDAAYKVAMARSMELLHLAGNSIFLSGLIALWLVIGGRWVKWAVLIETFHLYEHLMLTATCFTLGKPVGLSTLFGGTSLMSTEAAVGVRVTWHFLMNLFPMPLAMMGMMRHWQGEPK
jgi:hypothetical protein